MKRPWICPEPRCQPIFHAKASDYPDISVSNSGQSFICFGESPETSEFTYNGVTHCNDLGTCMFSPLKGLVKFQMNEADWEWLGKACERSLEKLKEIRCTRHGKK